METSVGRKPQWFGGENVSRYDGPSPSKVQERDCEFSIEHPGEQISFAQVQGQQSLSITAGLGPQGFEVVDLPVVDQNHLMILAREGLWHALTGHVKQVVDEGKVVNVDPSGKVWTPGSHKEIHIGQVAEKPAAHEK